MKIRTEKTSVQTTTNKKSLVINVTSVLSNKPLLRGLIKTRYVYFYSMFFYFMKNCNLLKIKKMDLPVSLFRIEAAIYTLETKLGQGKSLVAHT